MDSAYVTTVILAVVGLMMGSFVGASVWRLRALQLHEDEASGDKVTAKSKKQISKLQKGSLLKDRSVCMHCGHQLEWYDLIPLFSWASLGGKCRYCRKSIGWFEPVIELSLAAFFVLSYLLWPEPLLTFTDYAQFGIWLIAGVSLAILLVYDARWLLLPNRIVFPLIGLGLINALIVVTEHHFTFDAVMQIIYACLILSGLYYLIYVASRYRWVGFGDIKLGLALALLLADWKLAIVALFLANAVGTLIILPPMLLGKVSRQAHIPFGPFLIIGWFLAGLFGQRILDWYMAISLGIY